MNISKVFFVSDEMQSCGIGKLFIRFMLRIKKLAYDLNVYQKNARAIFFFYQR